MAADDATLDDLASYLASVADSSGETVDVLRLILSELQSVSAKLDSIEGQIALLG